jgi:two-component system cell cycle response regulator DivK
VQTTLSRRDFKDIDIQTTLRQVHQKNVTGFVSREVISMALIVVIEDNEQSARLAAKLLRNAKHEVIVAEDGESGLTAIFEHSPDLILIDLGLPDIDGQTVISLLNQQEGIQASIIAFTAWPEDTAREMATAYGCSGVITKPMNTRTFVAEIESYLSPVQDS